LLLFALNLAGGSPTKMIAIRKSVEGDFPAVPDLGVTLA
jgi:hypothetical protein